MFKKNKEIKYNNLKLKVLFLLLILFSFTYSEDNYVFDSNRIKKVFCEWELIDEKNNENIYIRYFNKEKNIYIDISNYANKDTIEIAEKRFHQSSLDTNFKYLDKNRR